MPDRPTPPDPSGVRLRPATGDDAGLLQELHRTGPAAQALAAAGLPAAALATVLAQQHAAREAAYGQHPGREDLIVEAGGRAVGRLLLATGPDGVRIVDVALLPAARGAGLGTALIRQVQARAAADGRPVRLHAEAGGRAEALYRRLGFVADGEPDAVRVPLAWRPGARA